MEEEAVVMTGGSFPLAGTVLIGAFVVLAVLFLNNFLSILPYLSDAVFRARGSSTLESSVKAARDRNTVAAIFLIPMLLIMYRYRLYDPDIISGLGDTERLLGVAVALLGYLLLRYMMYLLCGGPRKEGLAVTRRLGFTFFVLGCILLFLTVGLMLLLGVSDLTIRVVALAELGFVYFVYFLRRARILSGYYSLLQVFLYLCALEILPGSALIVTAVLL